MVSAFTTASILVASLATSSIAVSVSSTPSRGNILAGLRGSTLVTSAIASPLQISYTYGSRVLTNSVNLYYVYYGNWTEPQKSIVEDFTKGLGSSDWYGITREYYYQMGPTTPKVYVSSDIKIAKTVVDNYSLGKSLSGNALPNIIQSQIDAGVLPEDTDGVYVVLTAGDVTEKIRDDFGGAAFCSAYCGYHVSWQLKSGKRIYYAMVGVPTACMGGCAPQQNQAVSPNGDTGVDAMLSALAHEISEAVTDPWSDGTRAWQDSTGNENADKCAYNYGTTAVDNNGAAFNVAWSGRNYMIQQNWDLFANGCRLSPAGTIQSPSTTTTITTTQAITTTTTVQPTTTTIQPTTTTIMQPTTTTTLQPTTTTIRPTTAPSTTAIIITQVVPHVPSTTNIPTSTTSTVIATVPIPTPITLPPVPTTTTAPHPRPIPVYYRNVQ